MPLGVFLAKRIGLILLTLMIVSIGVFLLSNVLPGDIGRTILGPYATAEQVDEVNRELGLDRPPHVRYVEWIGGFATGDWGESLRWGVPVWGLVSERAIASAKLAFVALALLIPSSISLGVLAGLRADGWLDRTITVLGLSLTAIPEFVSGVVLLYVLGLGLGWFPISGAAPPGAGSLEVVRHLVLPAIPLALLLFGYVARMIREHVREELSRPYVRTAYLKGASTSRVVMAHVLRNALTPGITIIASQIGWLLGGLVVVETLFQYPGLGRLVLDSAVSHDLPVLQASTLVVALAYGVSNLAADVLYAILTPRVRAG